VSPVGSMGERHRLNSPPPGARGGWRGPVLVQTLHASGPIGWLGLGPGLRWDHGGHRSGRAGGGVASASAVDSPRCRARSRWEIPRADVCGVVLRRNAGEASGGWNSAAGCSPNAISVTSVDSTGMG
jgi:hypothetical protein